MRVSGPFDVKLTPLPADPALPEGFATRLRIEKVFHGDLQATSVGQMLAVNTQVESSGAYVAVDRVEGSLRGRRGTFALVHLGTMARGKQSLTLPVVPDSGTGELQGLVGNLEIQIAPDGQHSYVFEYALP